MKVTSVNVGEPREIVWNGRTFQTGIFKEPVGGPVRVGHLNLAGDKQADLSVHGGTHKAVYVYPVEHYEFWRVELPDAAWQWGMFGENLTVQGLLETSIAVGDCFGVGTAVMRVTQPRMPCYKLNARFRRDDMIKRFLKAGRSGFYCEVITEGVVQANSSITQISQAQNRVSIADIFLADS